MGGERATVETSAHPRKKAHSGPLKSQDEDPQPTHVSKRPSKHTKNLRSSSKKGLSWGEEAKKLSSLVRSKYSCVDETEARAKVTQNQMKLLYLINQYSFASEMHLEEECWIRRIPVLVLLYEGIISQVFDYDYAPSLEVFQSNRVYMNITQEGKDDLDDLRQHGLIDALTLASSEYDQCLAYTVMKERSEPVLASMKKEWKEEVDSLLQSPYKSKKLDATEIIGGGREGAVAAAGGGRGGERNEWSRDELLLEVFWNESLHRFEIVSHSGYARHSTVTDIEDVSYVCSPCIPDCLRPDKRHARVSKPHITLKRNTEIAVQAVEFIKTHASDNIQDELEEVLKANGIQVFVAEWVPFGSNQMANLNDKLGSVERVQGGLFSAFIDDMPEGTRFAHSVSSTGHQIQILDYDLTEFVNFTADIFFEEDEGIIQIEEFGVSVQKDGSMMYGLRVESVLDRLYNGISMDHMSRLLVDITQDSSHVAHHLLSAYQRTMLNVLFSDRPTLRPKYRIIMCEDLNPMMVSNCFD
jgi:WD repeat-containing protein 35